MRIGVMGLHYGHIGGMLRSARQAPDAEWVGMVEADDDLYRRYAGEPPVRRYANLKEMLAEARPELVLEGVRHEAKADLIEACALARAHLLLDKPLCRTLEEWRRIRTAVQAGGVVMSMWFTSRWHPPFIALRQAVEAGDLGDIVSLVSTHPHRLSRQSGPAWYFDPAAYAGTFHDLACHGVDQIRCLTGAECVGVHALQTCRRFTDEPRLTDQVQASFQLSNGSLAALTADWLTPEPSPSFGDTRFILMGTEGSAHLRAYAEDHLLVVSGRSGVREPAMPPPAGEAAVQEMIEAIDAGRQPQVSTGDVLAVAHACLAAQDSAQRGGEFLDIRVDP